MRFDIGLDGGRQTTARAHPAASPRGVWLVVAHGAGAGQGHPFMVWFAEGLAARGIDVVTFDFPYIHDGRRIPDKAPVLEDAFRRVVSAMRGQPHLAARRLFIGGKSMGGRAATRLGAEGLEGLCGIVAMGYPLHPPGKPEQLRTAHLPGVGVPVLVVQGERDAFGTPGELEPVLRTMPARVTLHVVPGADHSLCRKGRREMPPGAVLDVVSEWLVRTAGGRSDFDQHP